MQFDEAQIAICERSWADNLDLALHVIRARGKVIFGWALAGILPFALVNHWILTRLPGEDDGGGIFGVVLLAVVLLIVEAPVATAFVTLYLGAALFIDKPPAGPIVRGFFKCLPQVIVLQVLVRLACLLFAFTLIIPFAIWPFMNEVILLERNRLFAGKGRVSTWNRSTLLHRGNAGEFLLRTLILLGLMPLTALAVWLTEDSLAVNLLGFSWSWATELAVMQGVFWLVAVYFCVARFLSYLDQRIRLEGWEVELLLRAERERLMRQIA